MPRGWPETLRPPPTIGNTRVSVAYYYFYDNIQLYEPLGKAGLAGGIYWRYLPPVFTGKYRRGQYSQKWRLPAFINISLISLQITLLTVLATYYIIHGHHSTIFAAYA